MLEIKMLTPTETQFFANRIKRGYIPNGEGATSYHQPLEYGKPAIADDDLVLWFTKKMEKPI